MGMDCDTRRLESEVHFRTSSQPERIHIYILHTLFRCLTCIECIESVYPHAVYARVGGSGGGQPADKLAMISGYVLLSVAREAREGEKARMS